MGWAIGTSIGAALANRDHPVVCITGDGSVLMSGQEITVALQENLSMVFIVLNESSLGMVKHGQRLTGAEQTGFSLPQVDFAMLAWSMGLRGITVRCAQDLLGLSMDRTWLRQGPVVLDVLIDKEQVPPIFSRTNTLKDAFVKQL
jgi:acetolactate synthase-1/2/3 large subunit